VEQLSLFVIGDEDTVLGFRLAGLPGVVATSADQARAALQDALRRPDLKIVILTERLAWQIREEVDRHLMRVHWPLIIEVPDREGPAPERRSVHDLVRAAIGFKI